MRKMERKVVDKQDVVRCCLKLYQDENKVSYYDYRKYIWQLRPGDLIFLKESFQPLLSYPRIDDTLSNVICGHMEEEFENSRRRRKAPKEPQCDCRKWYVYYRTNDGRTKKFYPPYDGMTVITRETVVRVLTGYDTKREEGLREHFLGGYVTKEAVDELMKEVRNVANSENRKKIWHV